MLGIGAWVFCSLLSYGLTFAYFQRKYVWIAENEYRQDMIFSIVWSLAGPISLVLSIVLGNFRKYGIKFV